MAGRDGTEPPLNDGFLKPPPMGMKGPTSDRGGDPVEKRGGTGEQEAETLSDGEWMKMFKEALRASGEYMQVNLRPGWSRSYRAFANRHVENSKYTTPRYRTRSQLFKPKTRMAVRKNDAAAAGAMFSVADVVSIGAELETDQLQVMTAKFVDAALNYRLDRGTRMTGPQWFLTCIGARQDAQVTGVCISKQYWKFEERDHEFVTETPRMDPDNPANTMFDGETGEQMMDQKFSTEKKVVEDRIMCDLIPAELAFADFTADWRDPVQSGGFWAVAYPVRLNDLEHMVRQNASRPRVGGGRWRTDLNIRELTKGRGGGEARQSEQVRRARDSGLDRYETRFADRRGDTIWIYDVYYRYNGEDWNWWTLGETIMLSDPYPTRMAYPEQQGDRPYVLGVGALETHKTHPMSPVESWQPLQQEMNEITNLALDAQKMSISPITKIMRGRNIDWKQVQGRGPDAMIMVDEPDDVTFEKAPGATGTEQIQLNTLNVDFDELSGTFSQGSVQTNRQLNETVGGMNILSGSAGNMTEFDLRVWAETWAEPAIRQMCRLIQHYESSETIIKVAGKTAGLITFQGEKPPPPGPLDQLPQPGAQPITVEQVLDNLDNAQISVKVNVGIGAQSPQQKLQNFGIATDMMIKMAGIIDGAGIIPDGRAWMEDLMGILGRKDADKYFKPKPDTGPPPEVQKIQLQMEMMKQKGQLDAAGKQQDMQLAQQQMQMELMQMMQEMRAEQEKMRMELAAEREKIQLQRQSMVIKQQGQIADQRIKQQGQVQDQRIRQQGAIADHTIRAKTAMDEHDMQVEQAETEHEMNVRHAEEQHAMTAQQQQQTHKQGLKQSDEASKAKVEQMKRQAAAKPKPAAAGKGKNGRGK
jgi:hypothetical protein